MYLRLFKLFSLLTFITPTFASHAHEGHEGNASKEPQDTIAASVVSIEKSAKDPSLQMVRLKLTNKSDGSPVTPKDLKVVHTQPVHLLIIDSSLRDYSHIHPNFVYPEKDKTVQKNAGTYEFIWSPKDRTNPYRLWVDVTPKATDEQEYARVDLPLAPLSDSKAQEIDLTVVLESTQREMQATLSFDQPLKKGESAMGTVRILKSGKPFKGLEPLMGAFAHIVGFYGDFENIVHIHPMGQEPTKASMRGGPELMFHITPEQSGLIKLFIQVQIDGHDVFFPMTVKVE